MQKRWIIILNVIVLMIVSISLIFIGISFTDKPEDVKEDECVEVNKVASFVYDICYDAYSKSIFIKVERSPDNYHLTSFEFSFFDFDQQVYTLGDVPNVGSTNTYKLPAEKNPENINVRMNVVKDFSSPICEEPRILFVKYCPARIEQGEVISDISPFSDVNPEDIIKIEEPKLQESDIFAMSLVDKEAVWENQCSSSWVCDAWEPCVDGIQRRTCEDAKDCYVPTKIPETVKYCDGFCEENWECSWSDCSGGFTTPKCKDLNNCGTTNKLPQKLSCDGDRTCVPDVVCGEWSSCEVDYNFIDLIGGTISDLSGSKSRVCIDNNKCTVAQKEVKECSINVDVYTKRFSKCGKEYVGVYNRLNNNLIARIDTGTQEDPHLNFYLDDNTDNEYCDYCFNGKKDGDENGIDCGGSCMSCSDKYQAIEYEKESWFSRLFKDLF